MMQNVGTLVLLHGALGAREQFGALTASLAGHGRILTLDFEGHGNAAARGRPYRIEHFAENVIELLDAEEVERADFFGYSMGGYVALHLAGEHRHRVGRVATLGTKFWWDTATAAGETRRLDPAIIRAKVPRFADTLAARHANAGGWETVLANTADCLRELGARPVHTPATLARLSTPARVIVGDRDNTVSVEESAEAARALPNGELAVLPRTPHPIEQVELAKLTPVLLDFFLAAERNSVAPPAR
jgi:pimeloyl-ACP methyl ester carboxylesterase